MMILLFGGDDYYPAGGANDLVGAFPSLEAVSAEIDRLTKEGEPRSDQGYIGAIPSWYNAVDATGLNIWHWSQEPISGGPTSGPVRYGRTWTWVMTRSEDR